MLSKFSKRKRREEEEPLLPASDHDQHGREEGAALSPDSNNSEHAPLHWLLPSRLDEPRADYPEETPSLQSFPKTLQTAQYLLYVSHFFGRLVDSCWQFTVVLFLAAISHRESLFLVSTYYLTTYLAVCVFGAPLGNFVDETNRWVAVRMCIIVGKSSVLLATGACYWLLWSHPAKNSSVPTDPLSLFLLLGIHVFGSVAQVLDQGFVVAMERDWVVVMSHQAGHTTADHGSSIAAEEQDTNTKETRNASIESWLAKTNVALRQIDLVCKVLGPALIGWVVGLSSRNGGNNNSLQHSAALLGGACLLALIVEYSCTAKIYILIPTLSVPQEQEEDVGGSLEGTNADADADEIQASTQSTIDTEERTSLHTTVQTTDHSTGTSLIRGLEVYMEQKVVWAGLALALMYLNSMSFGGIMTAYLLSKNTLSVEAVGLWRSVENLIGFLGTFAFSGLTKYTTVVMTGQLSSTYLFLCLSIAGAAFFIPDQKFATHLLIVSCAASRIGLWTFDITTTLLYQEFVPHGVRGLVGGTQQSLNSFFVVLTGCLGLVYRRPDQFYVFAIVSYFGVALGMIMYTVGVFCRRDLFEMAIDNKE